MEKAYRFRLYPNAEQIGLIQRTLGCRRFVYNRFLARRIEVYESERKTLGYKACSAELTALKRELPWLREVDSTALQSALRDLDSAYQNFFRRVKQGDKKSGFPKFKSKRKREQAYRSKNNADTIFVDENHVRLPKLGLVHAVISRPVQGRILSATVSRMSSGKYFVSLCCADVEIEKPKPTGKSVGIDVGLKELVVTSDGMVYPNHKYLRQSERKLARVQRALSRKPIGSANWEKSRVQVARRHERIANQRLDALHKLTTDLIMRYDVISVEDLAVRNMVRNQKLAKSIHDAAWGELNRQLEYKAKWYDKLYISIDRFFPSSQICSACGLQNANLKDLRVRVWTCPACGVEHDRDINAARNILQEGLRQVA